MREDQILEPAIRNFYAGRRGARHAGYYILENEGLLQHTDKMAVTVLRHVYHGANVTSAAVRIGEAIGHGFYRAFTWREQFDVGLFLISCLVHSGLYDLHRDDADVEENSWEPYWLYRPGRSKIEHQTGYMASVPFPHWTANVDEDGRKLVADRSKDGIQVYEPTIDPNRVWVRAVHKLESTGFRINQTMLDWVKAKNPEQQAIIDTARDWSGDFYHRVRLDTRGRMYLSHSPINFQQGDMSRGLIEFARGVRLTKQGLDAIYLHIANCSGQKGDIQERIQWAKDRHQQWVNYVSQDSYASNPRRANEWKKAPEPWQLLRACIELKTVKVGQLSHLIVPIDQSCSGLAWQAIMMGDESLAEMTNLRGGYHDLYSIIGDQIDIEAKADERRNIIKKIVMPKSYGGGVNELAKQVREWAIANPDKAPWLNTKDLDLYLKTPTDTIASSDITGITRQAIKTLEQLAPATKEYERRAMAFYESRLERLEYVQWLSPSDFLCRIRREVVEPVHGHLRIPGKKRIRPKAYMKTGEVNHDRMVIGSLANIIHSLDASLVHHALASTDLDVVTVHDSFGTHPSKVFELQKHLMNTMVMIEGMDVTLSIEAQDHGTDVTWNDLQSVRRMNDYLEATKFPKTAPTPPSGQYAYTTGVTPVVNPNATNVFS